MCWTAIWAHRHTKAEIWYGSLPRKWGFTLSSAVNSRRDSIPLDDEPGTFHISWWFWVLIRNEWTCKAHSKAGFGLCVNFPFFHSWCHTPQIHSRTGTTCDYYDMKIRHHRAPTLTELTACDCSSPPPACQTSNSVGDRATPPIVLFTSSDHSPPKRSSSTNQTKN